MNARLFACSVFGLLLGISCSISAASCQTLESQIERVLSNLHERRSLGSAPAETWTLEERLAHYKVPAVSIAVIHDGRIDWARAHGFLARKGEQPVDDRSLFQAASISKALSAFAALRLVDQGVLALDTPINSHLKNWRLPEADAGSSDSVTVARLLAHMAGLNVPGFPGYESGNAIPSLTQVLEGTPPAATPPIRIVRPPGTTWAYSGGGYVVLQQVLQDVTGQSFGNLMNGIVLTPIGMEHSTFQQPLPPVMEPDAAVGHGEDGEAVAGRWRVYPELAAAGLWTTASDLARFAIAVREAAVQSPHSLLSPRSAADLTIPRFGSFSLGLLVRRNGQHAWFTHNGGNRGYRALMYAYLTAGEGAVVMTNSDAGMALASEIINSIALVYEWPLFVPEELM